MQALNDYISRFRRAFPGFESFTMPGERYVPDERGYKDELVAVFANQVAGPLAAPGSVESYAEVGAALVELFLKKRPSKYSAPLVQNLVGWRYCLPLSRMTSEQQGEFAQLTRDLCLCLSRIPSSSFIPFFGQ